MQDQITDEEYQRAQRRATDLAPPPEIEPFYAGLKAAIIAFLIIVAFLFFANISIFSYEFPTMIVMVITYFVGSYDTDQQKKRHKEAFDNEVSAIIREKNDRAT